MTLAIVQARLGSTRLHGKSLMPIGDKPLIVHVLERAQQIRGIRFTVLAVPPSDILAMPAGWTVMGFDGLPDHDVLGRFAAVLERYPACETVMRITGDCPLLDPAICGSVLDLYFDANVGYCSNVFEEDGSVVEGYQDGTDCEVFSARALRRAHRFATDPVDREHVTPYIRRNNRIATLYPSSREPKIKTSVDTLEDLETVRAMCSRTA